MAFALKAFFTVVAKDPVAVAPADVFEFLADQRGDRSVVRLADRESGLSARTIARRLSSVSGLYAYLVVRGDTPVRVNPVPRGLSTRRQGGSRTSRTAYSQAATFLDCELDRQLADLRARIDTGTVSIRQGADLTVANLTTHLAQLGQSRVEHFGDTDPATGRNSGTGGTTP